jgi:hypothetical protein
MKFLVFLMIIVAIGYVTRWIQRVGASRPTRRPPERSPFSTNESPYAPGRRRTVQRATDMILCPRCAAYIPADFPTACAREDCQFPKAG